MAPESGTLKVYNYEEYIAPSVLRKFQREYGVEVEVTTFTSMDEAIANASVTTQSEEDAAFEAALDQSAAGETAAPPEDQAP